MADELSKLATDMTSKPEGLSTTAWLMKKFENAAPNNIVIIEALKTQANNRLKELASEAIDQNNYTIKDRLSRLAQENPALYKSFAPEVQTLETTTAEFKNKKESFVSEYKALEKTIEANPSASTTDDIKNKISDLTTRLIKQRQLQIDLEYKQAKLFDTIFIAAGQAGISLPAEKKRITPSG